ncbi:MAG: hydroxyacid dehydrogenase [Candidatus Caldatribacteriaceae bacterium]
MAKKWKVLLPQPVVQAGMELLEKNGKCEVIVFPSPDMGEIKKVIGEIDALLVRSGFKVRQDLLEMATRLKVISRVGAGLDNIDVEYARKKGIEVLNVEGANALSVAEHTISFILALAKNLFDFDRRVRRGEWDVRYTYRAFEVQGKTLGLVGFGLIGRETARLALSLGMRVLFYDPFIEGEFGLAVERVHCLDDLLRESDFVSLHTPLSEHTRGMIGEKELKCMKPTAFLINVSRGAVVDTHALCRALREKWIAGAATDVFAEEPPPANHVLFSFESIIVTPHVAGLTRECSERVAIKAVENLIRALEDREREVQS